MEGFKEQQTSGSCAGSGLAMWLASWADMKVWQGDGMYRKIDICLYLINHSVGCV